MLAAIRDFREQGLAPRNSGFAASSHRISARKMEFGCMQAVYREHGVRFRYPEEWELTEQEHDRDVTITVSSLETSFWSISLFFDGPQPEQLIESAVAAFREEYDEVDDYPTEATLCHRANVSRDVEFVCLELINSAFLRAFRTGQFSALVLYQGTDHELQETQELLESISASLQCEGDEAIFS